LRTFYAKVLGVSNSCSDAAKTPQQDLQAVSNGTGDSVTAYQDAQTAADTCGQASLSLPSVPDGLHGLGLDDGVNAISTWATDEQLLWKDTMKVLNNESAVANAADAKTWASSAQDAQIHGIAKIMTAAIKIGANVDGVQPIAPGS
jgi:hypothetical protein